MDEAVRKVLEEIDRASGLKKLAATDGLALTRAQEELARTDLSRHVDQIAATQSAAILAAAGLAPSLLEQQIYASKDNDLLARSAGYIGRTNDLKRLIEFETTVPAYLTDSMTKAKIVETDAFKIAIGQTASALQEFDRYKDNFGGATLAAAHHAYATTLAMHAKNSAIEAASIALGNQWNTKIGAFSHAFGPDSAAKYMLESHYLSVSTSELLIQEYVARVSLDNPWAVTTFSANDIIGLKKQFTGLGDIYSDLLKSYSREEHFIASLPPVVSEGASGEMLESVLLLDAFSSGHDEQGLNASVEARRKNLQLEEPTSEMLRALNPAYYIAFIGAMQALQSSNIDRARHVIVSLRELVTHVLHHLAPDDAVLSWTVDPKHLHNGRPTRAARLYYICREINRPEFDKFVETDVRSMLACIDLFQRGTHQLESGFTDAQLGAIVNRTEGMLRFLIMTARTAT